MLNRSCASIEMLTLHPFTPRWLQPREGDKLPKGKKPPVFHLVAGSILERDQFEAEMEGRHHAGMVLSYQLLQAAEEGLAALLGERSAELTDLLRADFSGGDSLPVLEQAKIKEATEILARHWPDYGALVQRESRRSQILPTLAFAQWCRGWDHVQDDSGKAVDYARTSLDEIDDALLRRVPFTMIRAAGMTAYALQYGRAQEKN